MRIVDFISKEKSSIDELSYFLQIVKLKLDQKDFRKIYCYIQASLMQSDLFHKASEMLRACNQVVSLFFDFQQLMVFFCEHGRRKRDTSRHRKFESCLV